MKKSILVLLASLLVFTGCEQKWVSGQDLGVYSTRINLSEVHEADFVLTVFSNQGWTASVSQGADWLSLQETSGSSLGYVHVHADANMEDAARVAKILLKANSGVSKVVNIVQSGNEEKAADVPDELL